MEAKHVVSVILVVVLIAACGCTGTQTAPPPGTAPPAATQAQQGGTALIPGPTDAVPEFTTVTVDVGEKEFDGTIPVIFRGGKGLVHTKKIDVKMTRNDGSVQTATVGTKVGDEVILQGTRGEPGLRGQADRVEVWVTMDSGQTYKVADVLREYRTRG
jgi:hypothetical protein